MDGSPQLNGDAARWPWIRTVAFALVSSGIGTFGHAFATHASPSLTMFLAAAAVFTAYARMFAGHRIRAGAMLLSVTAAQLLVHATMLLDSPTTMHGMDHGAAAHLASQQASVSLPAMLSFHLLAILLGVAVLLRLERAAWTQARVLVSAVVRFVRRVVGDSSRRSTQAARPAAPVSAARGSKPRHWTMSCSGLRGPPAAAATHQRATTISSHREFSCQFATRRSRLLPPSPSSPSRPRSLRLT